MKKTNWTMLTMMTLLLTAPCFQLNPAKAEDKPNEKMVKRMEARKTFNQEGIKLRKSHIEEMRNAHLLHVNALYDLKLKHLAELEEIRKGFGQDKAKNEEIKNQVKAKTETQKKEIEELQKNFHETVQKKMNEDFKMKMEAREADFKKKM